MIPNTIHYVVYNGIQLNLTRIESFETEIVYDEGEVDRVYNHLRIRVSGIANQTVNYGGLGNASLCTYLRTALMEPRRQLIVAFNGVTTINISGPDANNGPNPLWVKVYDLKGATIQVDFEIEAWEAACPSTGVIVTSNRWTQTSDIDFDAYTTLTSSGSLTINSDRTLANADYYRSIPQPVRIIPEGFQRISQSYQISSDGNEMTWTVVDQEKFVVAPAVSDDGGQLRNITRWEGTWTEGTSLASLGGALINGVMTVKAWGQKDTPKKSLLQFCLNVLNQRRLQFVVSENSGIISSWEMEEGLNENYVSVTAGVFGVSLQNFGVAPLQSSKDFGKPIDTSTTGASNSIIGDRGNAGLFLAVKDIVPTCSSKTTITVKTSEGSSNDKPSPAGNAPGPGTKALATQRNQVKQNQYPYVRSKIETRNVTNGGVIQLPRASGNPATESFIATMNAPVTKRIVRFEMERLNQAPDLPQPTLGGCVLLHAQIDAVDPEILPSGVDRIYVLRGQYIFAVREPLKIGTDTIQMPHQITDNLPLSDNPQTRIAASNFIAGLIQ